MKILNLTVPTLCFFTMIPSISSMDNLTTHEKNQRLDAISTRNQLRRGADQIRQSQATVDDISKQVKEAKERLEESQKTLEAGNLEYERAKQEAVEKRGELSKMIESLTLNFEPFTFEPRVREDPDFEAVINKEMLRRLAERKKPEEKK